MWAKGLDAMMATNRLAGECEFHTSEKSTTTVKHWGRQSKTEVSMAPQKDQCQSLFINVKTIFIYLKLYLVTSVSFLVLQDDRHAAISHVFSITSHCMHIPIFWTFMKLKKTVLNFENTDFFKEILFKLLSNCITSSGLMLM